MNRSPFEVLYSRPPRYFGIEGVDSCAIPNLESWLKDRHIMSEMLQQQLLRAQQRMKSQADKKRTERSFDVGDREWLKLTLCADFSCAHSQ